MAGNEYSIKAVIRAVDKFSPGLTRMAANMESFGRNAKNVGRGMTRNLSMPIAAFGVFTLKTAVDFESSMNRVEALSRETGDTLASMRDLARDLGARTAFSATEAADAMGFLAMAGWDANQILSGTESVLNLAASSGIELARAADIASNIMGQFQIQAKDASRVSDVLASATATANVDMEMLAESFKYAGPVANKFGLSLEDTAAAIGLLGNVGIQGSNAGTALKNTMLGLVNPTGNAGKMLKSLGVQTRTAQGDMRPLADVLGQFGDAINKLGQGDQLLAIETLFGKLSVAGATELLAQAKSGAFQDYANSLKDVGGRAQEMADILMKGAPGAIKEFQSSFAEMQLAIAGSGFLEFFARAARNVTWFIRGLANVNPELLRMGTMVAGVVVVAGPAIWVLGSLASAMGTLFKAAAFLKFGLAYVVTALNVLKVAALANPITAMAVAAAAAAYLIYDNWGGIVSWFTDKFDAIRAAFDEGIIQGLVALWQEFNPATLILESINGLVNALTGIDVGAILMDKLRSVTGMLPDWAKDLLDIGDMSAPGSPGAGAGGPGAAAMTRDEAMERINRAGVPRPLASRAQVDVNFSNLPPGARVDSKAEGEGMDLGVGRGYALQRPM